MLPIIGALALTALALAAAKRSGPPAAALPATSALGGPPPPPTFPVGTTFLTLLAPQFGEAASQGAPVEQTVPMRVGTALVIYPPQNWDVPITFEGFSSTSSGIPAAAELAAAPFAPGNFGLAYVAQFPGEVRVNLSAPMAHSLTERFYFAVDVTVSV